MKVSVCMAVYNGEKFIKEQIDSILPQLGPQDELIVSDDGSKDRTLKILSSYQDDRITILNSNSKNIIKNFENALSHAKGEYIFLSDQDDIWRDTKINDCLLYLKSNDLVFSNLEVFTDDISNTKLLYNNNKTKTGIFNNIMKNNYIGATMAFNRNVLEKALPFPKGIYMHDIWLAMVAEVIGKTYFIDKPLIYYRRHSENASETGEKSSNSLIKKTTMRIQLVYNLLRKFI